MKDLLAGLKPEHRRSNVEFQGGRMPRILGLAALLIAFCFPVEASAENTGAINGPPAFPARCPERLKDEPASHPLETGEQVRCEAGMLPTFSHQPGRNEFGSRWFADEKDHRWEGFWIGFGTAGLMLGSIVHEFCSDSSANRPCIARTASGFVFGGVMGGVVGGLIGSMIPKGDSEPPR